MTMDRWSRTCLVAWAMTAGACAVDDGNHDEPELDEVASNTGTLRLSMSSFDRDRRTTEDAHKIYIHGFSDGAQIDMIVGNYTGGDNSRSYDITAFVTGTCFGGGSVNDLLPIVDDGVQQVLGPGQSLHHTAFCEIGVNQADLVVVFAQR